MKPNPKEEIGGILGDPIVDRTIATVASLPFAYLIYHRRVVQGADLPRVAMALQYALLIATMVVRRPGDRAAQARLALPSARA